jgi:hypothetical protein
VAPTEVVLFTTTSAPLPAAPTAASLLAAADEIGESVSEQEAATFIRTYYDAVSRGEYDTTWGLLSPEFQRGMARSYDYYSDFWNENDAEVGGVEVIQADEDGAVVAVELYWNGSDQAESHQFTLRRGGSGELLIVGQD